MTSIALCNLNLAHAERGGCDRIREALATLAPEAVVHLYHFTELAAAPELLARHSALILGPQGTPFSAYDAHFLPWLHALVETFPGPVLGVCGGMQALALAWGARLNTAYGEALGQNYDGLRKIRGPLDITLDTSVLPAWLPDDARGVLHGWGDAGGRCCESHVEQVIDVPSAFVRVAFSEPTPVEAMMHKRRPIMASQFHPELGWTEGCGAGQLWLQAWLDVVRALA